MGPPADDDDLRTVTPAEAAELMGISVRAVRELVRTGHLRSVPTGTSPRAHRRIPLVVITEWIKRGGVVLLTLAGFF